MIPRRALPVLAAGLVLTACSDAAGPELTSELAASPSEAVPVLATLPVEGQAIHYFTTAAVHSQEPTATGFTQRSSETIRLTGDLDGWVLYHPTSEFDFQAGTLVNTGTQIFSGTVLDSEPLLLHDDRFRFEVDLNTGATTGEVYLGRSLDAPHRGSWAECRLQVVGTGQTAEGDGVASYTGSCTRYGRR